MIRGRFHLTEGTVLIARPKGGIVIRDDPFRLLRVNDTGFRMLEKCRTGLMAEDICRLWGQSQAGSVLATLDRLCSAGLVEWEPAQPSDEPFVSIVIPVYNRSGAIGPCLESLLSLDYPEWRREIIVVDDGSTDDTLWIVAGYDVRLIELSRNQGQSAARNHGAVAAKGEVLAFIDSDCVADPSWLKELVPYFQDSRTALIGGYVASFYQDSLLDRYEDAKSPLNMGEQLLVGYGAESDFYVPTCNMLVRKDAYLDVGGLNESFRVGEDVDLCWRLKAKGYRLVYVPKGRVKHKHRNRFVETFSRRFDYGTSEPALYVAHNKAAKRYPWQPWCVAALFGCLLGLFLSQPVFVPLVAAMLLAESAIRKAQYEKQGEMRIPFTLVLKATMDKHVKFSYYLTYHAIRYHLVAFSVLCAFFSSFIPVAAALVLFPAVIEYWRRRPRLSFPAFLLFFVVEQVSYQAGVFWGCVRQRSFRPYRIRSTRSAATRTSPLERDATAKP